MARTRKRNHRHFAFSLVELVMVVTIIGIISAIAVPRMTTANSNAIAAYLEGTLNNVRKAMDMYFAEHGASLPDNARFLDQLTQYSDANGNTSSTPGGAYIYGPYLRAPFPRNPFNKLNTVHVKAVVGDPNPTDGSVGWVAVLSDGYFGISARDDQLIGAGIDAANPVIVGKFRGAALGGG
jgi:prepilin-type N-terminal cleavage/methylation domain-containing protein